MLVPVPPWNARGVIDPIDESAPVAATRSPYNVSLREFVLDFAISEKRVTILKGYLEYRSRLHAVGLLSGFQWLDGSFLEHIELTDKRPPGDLDVVTFYDAPNISQLVLRQADPFIFPTTDIEHDALKRSLYVDAYAQSLTSNARNLVRASAYWYSMWSHRRDLSWKGFIQVDLAPIEDAQTAMELDAILPESFNEVPVPGVHA